MSEDSGSKTIEALPTGLVERITQEQALLDSFNFEVVGGNALLDAAEFVCLLDPNHEAPDHSSFGNLIKAVAKPEDVILIESDNIEGYSEEHSLPRDLEIKTWEDLEQFYLAHLILDRYKLIGAKISSVNVLLALQGIKDVRDRLAKNINLLDHPELLSQVETDVEDPVVSKYSRKIEGLKAAKAPLKEKMDKVALSTRNMGLIAAVDEELKSQKQRRVFIIAGAKHFAEESEEVTALLGDHSHIILRPRNFPAGVTEEGVENFKKPMSPEQRAYMKAAWLAARSAKRTAQTSLK